MNTINRKKILILAGIILFIGCVIWIIGGASPKKAPDLYKHITAQNLYGKQQSITVSYNAEGTEKSVLLNNIEETDHLLDALHAIQSIVIQVCETKEPIHVPPSNYDLYILGREMDAIYISDNLMFYTSNGLNMHPQTYIYVLSRPLSTDEINKIVGDTQTGSAA